MGFPKDAEGRGPHGPVPADYSNNRARTAQSFAFPGLGEEEAPEHEEEALALRARPDSGRGARLVGRQAEESPEERGICEQGRVARLRLGLDLPAALGVGVLPFPDAA